MDDSSFSLADLQVLSKYDPDLKGLLKRKFAANNEQFVEQLYIDIDDAIHLLETQKHMYQQAHWGEDELTGVITAFLKGRNYDAEHDTQHGGHIDLLVKHHLGRFEWIGEAKIWNGPAYIYGGWTQLNERYGTGTYRDNFGGIIIYVKQKKSQEKFSAWQSHLLEQVNDAVITLDNQNPLRFSSTTNHPASDQPYFVRHMAVSLFHFIGSAD